MRVKNLGVNAILNIVRQSLSIVFPLITYPYALRVLGVDNIGKVNYSASIVTYFSLIAMLGIANYAIREGAKLSKDRKKISRFVSEIFTINVISTVVSLILLIVVCTNLEKFKLYLPLILIQSINIITRTIGIDWVNNIFEDFLYITVRSIGIYIANLLLLFVLVRTPQDYILYACISVITGAITCLMNWFYCKKYVDIKLLTKFDIKAHMPPILVLFANAVAISIYVNVDITMLGWFKGDYAVGIYSTAVKVYSIVKNLLVAIYAVAVPRLSTYAGNEDWGNYKSTCSRIWGVLALVLIPISIGMACLSDEIVAILGGKEFADAGNILRLLSLALIFAIFGGVLTACMNISLRKEKMTLKATVISAILNFGLNIFLVPWISCYGAAITTLISEVFVFVYSLLKLKPIERYIDIKSLRMTMINALIGGGGIVLVSILLRHWLSGSILYTVVVTLISVLLYIVFMMIRRDYYFGAALDPILRKMKKRLN